LRDGDEVILVDDASTDETPKVLAKASKSHPMVKVLNHSVNKGTAAAARNTGIEAASNQLIFCLDSDNILSAASIPSLVSCLLDTGADAAAFGEIHYFRDNPQAVTHKWIHKECIGLADALAGVVWPGPSGNYLFTRESWKRAGRYCEPSLENRSLDSWMFGIRQLATGSRLVTLPHTWYFHRYGHMSHYMENWQRGNQSLAALIALIPFLHLLDDRDVDYIFSPEGRYTWYERLSTRPIRVKPDETGENGRVEYLALFRRDHRRRLVSSAWAKVRSRLGGLLT
jgi:glycosyltransferase involved in cell wall biosynthesis